MFKWLIILLLSISTVNAQISRDKQLHLVAGAVVGGWGYITVKDKGFNREIAAISWGAAAGIGKETMDGIFKTGTVDKRDIYYTVAGTIGSVIVIRSTKEIIKIVKKRHGRNYKYKK